MGISSICVFCGSSKGRDERFQQVARSVGLRLGALGTQVVFGGGSCGLMGAVADGALTAGGRVVGVIPKALERREVAHQGVTELHIVSSMHERKAMMTELSDAFLTLPGGLGTLEELFEVLSWAQLGIHSKPIGLLNVHGFFDPLLAFIDRSLDEGFLRAEHRSLLIDAPDIDELLDSMAAYEPAAIQRWLDLDEG